MRPGEFLKKKYIVAAAIFGVLLTVISYFVPKGAEVEKEDISYYSDMLEKQVEELVETLDGVSSVKVMLTLDTSGEYVYAENSEKRENGTVTDYLVISTKNSQSPVLVKEIYPRVRGVAVVCDGGGSAALQAKITSLLSSALGISANRITVCG